MLLSGKFVDATEKIYQLVKQWSLEIDREQLTKALCEIALVAGCISPEEAITGQVNEHQYVSAIEWLQKNHPNIYLWAIGQRYIGHPTAIWGLVTPKQNLCSTFWASSASNRQKTLNSSSPSPIFKIHSR